MRRGRSPRPTIFGRTTLLAHHTLIRNSPPAVRCTTGIQRISPPRTGRMIAQTALPRQSFDQPKGMSLVPHPPFRDPLPKLHIHRHILLSLRYTTAAGKSDRRSANSAMAGQSPHEPSKEPACLSELCSERNLDDAAICVLNH